jgi:hypothetical protein
MERCHPLAKAEDVMNRDDYIRAWAAAAQAGTLLTPKHDPSGLPTIQPGYRTVACMSPAELERYIAAGDYGIRVFTNNNPKHTPHYCELVPRDPAVVPGSGVPPMSPMPTTACDRFVAVSGRQQGWHLFAETSANIQAKEQAGHLSLYLEFL